MITVAGVVALLVVLLIEGCVSEHSQASTATSTAVAGQLKAPAVDPLAGESKRVSTLVAHPVTSPAITPSAAMKPAPPAISRSEPVYVVKAGDTLTKIARQHHTTVKALKAVNCSDSDLIVVGAKLKLPSA
jgi:LysM repeat protein